MCNAVAFGAATRAQMLRQLLLDREKQRQTNRQEGQSRLEDADRQTHERIDTLIKGRLILLARPDCDIGNASIYKC